MNKITYYLSMREIELESKLVNMLGSEISDEIYEECKKPEIIRRLKTKIWDLLTNPNEPFSNADYYSGLANGYEAKDINDRKSAEVYNCDLLYMVAIASVLGLKRPETADETEIFGI